MSSLWRSFQELLPIAAALASIMGMLLWWWRRLTRAHRHHQARVLAAALGLIWAIGVALVTLRPSPAMISASGEIVTRRLDLAPGREIWDAAFNSVSAQVFVEQAVGNLVLFMPLGIVVAMARASAPKSRLRVSVVAGAAAGLLVETLQWVLGTGRVSSIDDVILAILGAVAGSGVARGVARGTSRRSVQPHGEPSTCE